MNLRRERMHHSGASNLSDQWSRRSYCTKLSLAQVATKTDSQSSLPKSARISPLKAKSIHETIHERSGRVVVKPVEHTKQFYEAQGREIMKKTIVGYPRTAQLEEKEKRKTVFTGESEFLHHNKLSKPRKDSYTSKTLRHEIASMKEEKQTMNELSNQEKQLNETNKIDNDTFKTNINLEKVKEARRLLRRKYSTMSNIQRIYSAWDQDNKGEISVENVFSMSKKLGLNLNFDEARVLVASADKKSSGTLNLDEFLDLIYERNEDLNVNFTKLATISTQDYSVQKEEQLNENEKMLKKFQEEAKIATEVRRANQLTLILKNRLSDLSHNIVDLDPDRSGYINFSSFETAIKRLQISEAMLSDKDIKELFDKHKVDSLKLDYALLFDTLKNFKFPFDQDRRQRVPDKLRRGNSLSNSQTLSQTYEFGDIVDCRNLPYNLMVGFHKRSKKVGRAIQRLFPSKRDLNEYLANILKLPEDKIEKHCVTKNEFQDIMSNLFQTFKVSYLNTRDFEGFFASILYNHNGFTNFKEITHTIYEETENQFFEKVQMRMKGPAPHQSLIYPEDAQNQSIVGKKINSSMDNLNLESSELKGERSIMRESQDIRPNTERKSINANISVQKCLHHQRSSLPSINSSMIEEVDNSNTPRKNKDKNNNHLKFILNKLDSAVFMGRKPAFKVFNEFDVDKDGYVSYRDIITKLMSDNQINREEFPQLLEYLDPNHKGYVNFQEFSKKIRPNMVYDNEYGKSNERNIATISKPNFQEINESATKTKKLFDAIKKAYDPSSYNYLKMKPKTKSGANPAWTNTFLNFQPNSNVSMFISEEERFDRHPSAATRFQAEDREKKETKHKQRVEIMRQHQNIMRNEVERANSLLDSKQQNTLKKKYLAQMAYEKNAKFRNVFT